ncbi:MAG: hypothetical protein UIH27_10970 [Ruminococcus sp.]|nr:hypothetical protein [Ruminococcus sp.]
MNSSELKQMLKELLALYCPSLYFLQCPPNAGFPRTEYEFKQISIDGYPYEKAILTLNLYDKSTQEAIDTAIDNLVFAVDKSIRYTADHYYQIYYNNDRQSVPDADRTLRRVMLSFEIRIYTRSETI